MYIISNISKRVIVTFMLDEEPFSKPLPIYCLGGPFYVFRSIFSKIPALQKERKCERNNFIKIYPPPDLNKNILPLLHMHPRSHEFTKTKLSDKMKKWYMKLVR